MIPLAQIGFWKNGVDTHDPHHSTDLLSIDTKLVISSNDLGNCPITPSGMICMQLVYSTHDEQVLIRDASHLGRISIDAATINFQQLCLAADSEVFVIEVNVIFSSSRVRGFQQIFFSTSQPHRSAGQLFFQDLRCVLCSAQVPFRLLMVLS